LLRNLVLEKNLLKIQLIGLLLLDDLTLLLKPTTFILRFFLLLKKIVLVILASFRPMATFFRVGLKTPLAACELPNSA
jgi:hypothetical protein